MKHALKLMMLMALALPALAQQAPEQALRALLTEFLDAAGRGDKAVFQRFFADDVIYTRSTGAVIGKAEIMKSLDQPRPAGAPLMTYAAEDVTVRVHGSTAVVNFRLAGRAEKDGKTEITHYRNTGAFLLRNGRWQVVAWQATRLAEPGDD